MTVYIEFVIIDNFFITFLAAILSYRFTSVTPSRARAVAASVLGTCVAVVYPFIKIHNIFLIMIKLCIGAALSFILFYKKYSVLKGGGAFIIITFLFGGALFALGLMMYADAEKALRLPLVDIPIGLIIAAALAIYVILRKAAGFNKRIRAAEKYVSELEIDVFSKTIKIKGFLDTGNRLYDYKSGLPVVVVNIKAALELLDEEKLRALTLNKGMHLGNNAHYIDYSTVASKNNKLLVLKPDEIRLYSGTSNHRIKDVMIGLSFSKFSDAAEYDAILHPAIFNKRSFENVV